MPVQINNEDFAKPWRPGIYPKSTTVIYNNQLWILNDTITGLYTSSDFLDLLSTSPDPKHPRHTFAGYEKNN